ncbi:hypothetical protein FNV43_RR16158 [Rhamnella rubrinervis]|uniref:DUF4378 domain-containing protein n=1 Tax=Rhamnella rubrinervis TaxID=2594499 RepID=A0A8K0GUY3_9ROSA|nr:hypothetical protein FNV43_RR16158 [Rhamnella rubrinervis]
MASSAISLPRTNFQQIKPFPIELRPTRTLKDFLNESSNSCSSSGFRTFPRQPFRPNVIDFKPSIRNSKDATKLQRHRSLKAASTSTISAFQAVINAVKNIQFTTVKSPSFLPRSLSRKLSKKEEKKANQGKITAVRIKDIIRWTSFRDLVEEISPPPFDLTHSPHHCTITTTSYTTGSTDSTSTSCNSHGSTWCDSDFTEEVSPSWRKNSEGMVDGNENGLVKNIVPCVGKDILEAKQVTAKYTAVGPQEGECDENEQQSPVSVLDFLFSEDEDPFSTFDQSLGNVNRTKQKHMQKIEWFESLAKLETVNLEKWNSMEESADFEEEEDEEEGEQCGVEERARELLYFVKATSSADSCKADVDQLLFDFLKYELSSQNNQIRHDDLNWDVVSRAKAWMSGEHKAFDHWWIESKREVFIRDMNKVGKWSKFEEEQDELVLEIESGILRHLVDELLVDYSQSNSLQS